MTFLSLFLFLLVTVKTLPSSVMSLHGKGQGSDYEVLLDEQMGKVESVYFAYILFILFCTCTKSTVFSGRNLAFHLILIFAYKDSFFKFVNQRRTF